MFATGCWYWVLVSFLAFIASILLTFHFQSVLWFSVLFLVLFVFSAVFFRDPERKIGKDIVSAADGKIFGIDTISEFIRIKTFMNIHNVHVNRAPISGMVINVKHFFGPYLPAYKKDADKNEKTIITMKTKIGEVKVVQIAGLFARRIVSYIKKGDCLEKGERIGIIRLGSRVDVYLPKNKVKVVVQVGDKIKAGETTIAVIK